MMKYLRRYKKISQQVENNLISLLNILEDKSNDESGTDWVVTVGPNNLNKLTDDEIIVLPCRKDDTDTVFAVK